MNEIKRTTLHQAFEMDDSEFETSVVMRYLESQDDGSATESELGAALKWARTAMTEAILLDGVLAGNIRPSVKQGEMIFQLVSPTK